MKDKAYMMFKTEVVDIIEENKMVQGVKLKNGQIIEAPYIFVAAGRQGSKWITEMFKNHHIKLYKNHVAIGVRVETNDVIM